MTRTFFSKAIGCLIISVFFVSATAHAELVQYLEFEGNLNDTAGNFNADGTLVPSATNNWVGDYSASFDGTMDSRVWIASATVLNSTNFTQMYWVRIPSGHSNGPEARLTATIGYLFETVLRGFDNALFLYTPGNGWVDPGFTFVPNVWYHLAWAYDDPSKTITLFVNGQQHWQAILGTPIDRSTANYHLIGYAQGDASFLQGAIDDYRMYDTPLSASMVQEIIYPDGLVQHLTFDETWADTVYAHDLDHNALAALGTDAATGTGSLDLTDPGAWTYFERQWDVLASPEFTQMVWMKVPLGSSNAGAARITAMTNFAFDTSLMNQNIYYYSVDNATDGWVDTGFSFPINVWQNLAWTYDGTTLKLVVDGQPVFETTPTNPIQRTNAPWTLLGGSHLGDDRINCLLDDYRMYNRVLSPEEILDILPRWEDSTAVDHWNLYN